MATATTASRTQRAGRRADWRSWTQAVTGVRSRSGRGGGWGAREAHEEEELTGSELAGVFARSNSETWPAVLGSVLRRRKATRDVKRRRKPKLDVCRERPVRRALGVCAPCSGVSRGRATIRLLGYAHPPGWPDPIECVGDDGVGVRALLHPEVEHEPGTAFEAGTDAPRSQLRDRLLRLPEAARQHLTPPLVLGHASGPA